MIYGLLLSSLLFSYYSIPAGMLGRGPHTLSKRWSRPPTASAALPLPAAAHRQRSVPKAQRSALCGPLSTPMDTVHVH
jgi:hypothetical protein